MAIDNAHSTSWHSFRRSSLLHSASTSPRRCTQANWAKNKGPFSGLTKTGDIEIGGNAYKSILKAVAAFSDKGFFEGDVVLIMDRETEG